MLKHLTGVAAVLAVALLLASWTSAGFVRAAPPPAKKKDPTAAAAKAATKQLKKLAKAASKEIRAAAKETVREIKRRTKIVKTGRGLEAFGRGPGKDLLAEQVNQTHDLVLDTAAFEGTYWQRVFVTVDDYSLRAFQDPSVRIGLNVSAPQLFSSGAISSYTCTLVDAVQSGAKQVQSAVNGFAVACEQNDVNVYYVQFGMEHPADFTCGQNPWFNRDFPTSAWTCTSEGRGSYYFNITDFLPDDGRCRVTCTTPGNETIVEEVCTPSSSGRQVCTGDFPEEVCDDAVRACRLDTYCDPSCDDVPTSRYCVPVDFRYCGAACTDGSCSELPQDCIDSNTTMTEMFRSYGRTPPRFTGSFIQLLVDVVRFLSDLNVRGTVPAGSCDLAKYNYVYLPVVQRAAKRGPAAVLDEDRFPPGAGPVGFTVTPDISAPDPESDLLILSMILQEDVPLSDPTYLYQYGFVFDQDGNQSNNFVPLPRFSNDFFQNTDKWYEVLYTPQSGWRLKVTDARNGGFVQVASAARAVINGNSITLAVPVSEFGVARPSFRLSAFRHTGDFGLNPPHDYSADYVPEPMDPLKQFDR
jgi:hypothetical protein